MRHDACCCKVLKGKLRGINLNIRTRQLYALEAGLKTWAQARARARARAMAMARARTKVRLRPSPSCPSTLPR